MTEQTKTTGAKRATTTAKTTKAAANPRPGRKTGKLDNLKADLAAARAAEAAAAADCADAGLNAEATAEVIELADGCTGMVPADDTTDEAWEASAGTAVQAEPQPQAEPQAEPGPDPDAELTFRSDNGGVRTVRAAAVKAVRDGAMMIDPSNPKGGRTIRGSIVFVERTVVRAKQSTTSVVEIESADPAGEIRDRLAALGYSVPERPAPRPRQVKEPKEPKAKAVREPRPEGERKRTVVTGRVKMSDADALKRAKEIIAEVEAAGGRTTRFLVINQLRAEGNQVAYKPLFASFDAEGLVPQGTRASKPKPKEA